ncbi:MAG: preprotein translocase subunit YajC [Gammaproteobacteria bacterium]|nr:preprotein translocase subunit YajC [Gammaproteobacteria bacterium]
MSFFINDAVAQTAGAAQQPDPFMSFLPLIILFVIFYFLLIRPQQKKAKEHTALVSALKKGDEVVTSGGILGKITEAGDNYVTVTIAEKTDIKIQRQAVSTVLPKGTIKTL